MGLPSVVNEVRLLDTPRGVARLRLQVHEDGRVVLRAEPAKGEADELIALAAIRILCDRATAENISHEVFCRRYREQSRPTEFVDVADAIRIYSFSEAAQLLEQFSQLLNVTVH